MSEEDVLRDPEEADLVDDEVDVDDEEDLDLDVIGEKKKKDLLNPEETDSLDDLEDEELDEEDEPYDDVTNY